MPSKDATFDNLVADVDVTPDVEETALSTNLNRGWSADPTFDQSDLYISKLRLAQGLTPEVQNREASIGQWVLTACPPMDKPRVIPLLFAKKVRRYGLVGTDKYVACNDHQGPPEADCPNCRTQYEEKLASGNFESKVEDYYQYVVYVPEHSQPAILEFARSGMGAGRILNAMVATRGLGHFAIQLGSNQVKGQRGTYGVPVISLAQATPEELEEAQNFIPRG